MVKSLSSMALAELEAEALRLHNARDVLKAEQFGVMAELEVRQADEEVRQRLSNMSDAEKASLARHIAAEGVPGSEEFGRIG